MHRVIHLSENQFRYYKGGHDVFVQRMQLSLHITISVVHRIQGGLRMVAEEAGCVHDEGEYPLVQEGHQGLDHTDPRVAHYWVCLDRDFQDHCIQGLPGNSVVEDIVVIVVDVLLHMNLGAGFLHRVVVEQTRHRETVDQTRRKEVVEKTNHSVVAEDSEMSTAVEPKAPRMEVVGLKSRHSSNLLHRQVAVNCMIETEVDSENTGVAGFVVVGEDYRTCELCRLVDMRWVVLNQNSHPVDCCVKSIQNCLPAVT